jgi:hypothetical protein
MSPFSLPPPFDDLLGVILLALVPLTVFLMWDLDRRLERAMVPGGRLSFLRQMRPRG